MFNCSSSRVRWHVIWIRKKSRIAKELARQGRWINQPIWQICASQIGSFLFLGIGVKIKKTKPPASSVFQTNSSKLTIGAKAKITSLFHHFFDRHVFFLLRNCFYFWKNMANTNGEYSHLKGDTEDTQLPILVCLIIHTEWRYIFK